MGSYSHKVVFFFGGGWGGEGVQWGKEGVIPCH